MHVGNDARQYEERTTYGKGPTDRALTVPEHNRNAEEHGYERNAEAVGAVETPIGPHDGHLVAQQISANASHHETDEKLSESARSTARVVDGSVFHATENTIMRVKKYADFFGSPWLKKSCQTQDSRPLPAVLLGADNRSFLCSSSLPPGC